jgi:nickel-dependent lactate racemase
MLIGRGLKDGYLIKQELREIIGDGLNTLALDGMRLLIIIPDSTRTMPMSILFEIFVEQLQHRVKKMDFLVALGTHQPLNDYQLSRMAGKQVVNGKFGNIQIFNLEWHKPETFIHIGTISAKEIELITKSLLNHEVPVHVRKLILNYD